MLGNYLRDAGKLLYLSSGNRVYTMKNFGHCSNGKRQNEAMKLVVAVTIGVIFGLFIGFSFPALYLNKVNVTASLVNNVDDSSNLTEDQTVMDPTKIWVPSNPRGAERLPPDIIVPESDFYLRRLWGEPSEDLSMKPKYLLTLTVGYKQKDNINAVVKKFSDNFTVLLFHYDGQTTEWDEFEWSKRAIHVSAHKQTKWWYAKRFLHPDIVASYEYIFIWDEDLGVEHFDAEEYIKLVKKHGLEISQPGLERKKGVWLTWEMTRRKANSEVHKETDEKQGWCSDPHLPPCAAFVEIMAPVFSRDAWRCVWHMVQNDLVHGWGLDFALRRCIESAHDKIGVVDAQPVVHQGIPSLGNEGPQKSGKYKSRLVKQRCRSEWQTFQDRVANAEKAYYKAKGIQFPTSHHQLTTYLSSNIST